MNKGSAVIFFANFLSDLAVDLDEGEVLTEWAQQAPRKAWLLRPGDVLVSPVPLGRKFLEYVTGLTGVPSESVTVIVVPPVGAVPLAQAVRQAGLTDRLRALAGEPGAALLPTALDASAIGFARDLGLTVHPYPTVDEAVAALKMTMLLNPKAGFREVAERLGMRLPAGQVCRRPEVDGVVREFLGQYERVVIKPDRSAGGHGMRFVARGDIEGGAALELDAIGGPAGMWVVEEYVDGAPSVSIQLETATSGTRVLFSGAMRTAQGSFTGYVSPLPTSCAHVAWELEQGAPTGPTPGRPRLRGTVWSGRAGEHGRRGIRRREQHPPYRDHNAPHDGHPADGGVGGRPSGMVDVQGVYTTALLLRSSPRPAVGTPPRLRPGTG
ncbi:preATP grasp domain-containing protein [Streptomyces mirabilis]|uniref:preATP grasp domain-containing protein n=1 Tax=Streptomyces mirabilis TaxID=68239 RepID=UPI003724323D